MARSLQLQIEASHHGARPSLSTRRCIRLARTTVVYAAPRLHSLEISVVFVSSAVSRKLQRELRHKDSPADVMSVPLHRVEPGVLIGQIVLCPACITQRTKVSGNTLESESAMLFVHGLLHVLGYDHKHSAGARAMERLERRILSSFAARPMNNGTAPANSIRRVRPMTRRISPRGSS